MGYMIDSAIAGVGIWIVSLIFKVAAFTFKIFMILAQSDILKEIEYGDLITNFYVLLGIIMLFVMAFALLRGMVNPDDQKQGTSVIKKMIINFVVSCIMLSFLPTIFQFAYDIQNSIIRWNVIGGFFGIGTVGSKLENNDNIQSIETSAYTMVNGVYTAFFNVSNKQCTEALKGNEQPNHAAELQYCQEHLPGPDDSKDGLYVNINGVGTVLDNNFSQYIAYVDNSADFGIYGAFRWAVANDDIEFNFILLLIAGIALVFIGISYCFDMALRLIKLIFYQLIAPIPIFLRVIPDSKFSSTFNNWVKVTLTCWMEVFVRIFIFYFCIFLCYSLLHSKFLTDTIFGFGWWTALFTKAFLLMGIVMFMKRSPKLLSEITGIDSGNMKLGIKDKFKEVFSAVGALPIVGTALRGTGTLGKKLISGWDAKRNGYNFSDGWKRFEGNGPYAKYKKWRDNFLPYSASNAESRKKAAEQVSEIEKKKKRGEDFAKDLQKNLAEAYKIGNLDLLDKVLEIKDKNRNIISAKDATSEMIQEAINNAGAGEFIKHLAATSSNKDFQALGATYNERSVAKRKMLEAKAEMEKVMNDQHSTVAERQAASKKFSEMNDSYEAIDNEWKQRLAALNNKKEIGGYNAMKYNEDRGNALLNENSYQATRNENQASGDSANSASIPNMAYAPSYGGPRPKSDAEQVEEHINKVIDLDRIENLKRQWESAPAGSTERKNIEKQIQEIERNIK